ncbi:MAG: type II toxin-antitoxin system RelE/ParE family toxin [Kiritimatiellia bacterium]
MESYEIVFKKSVKKDLKKVPKEDVLKILKLIRSLAENPRPPQVKKLSGQDRYRMRKGNYRILYSIEDDKLIITVVKVGDRRDVYR